MRNSVRYFHRGGGGGLGFRVGTVVVGYEGWEGGGCSDIFSLYFLFFHYRFLFFEYTQHFQKCFPYCTLNYFDLYTEVGLIYLLLCLAFSLKGQSTEVGT